jgi:vancomycin permeability regulator SanA
MTVSTGPEPVTKPLPVVDLAVVEDLQVDSAPEIAAPTTVRRRWWRRPLLWLAAFVVVVLAGVLGPWAVISLSTDGARYDVSAVPAEPVALVFGAGLAGPDQPSDFLAQRLDVTVQLWQQRKVQHILVSGDNSTVSHDEVGVMQDYLVRKGVPASVITQDHAGFDTYDSCYRARAVFGVTRAVLVTQDYHLARALWDCQGQGLHVVGVSGSEWSHYRGLMVRLQFREFFSDVKALGQRIIKPTPAVVGPPVPLN